MAPPSPGMRAGEGPGVGALPPAGRLEALPGGGSCVRGLRDAGPRAEGGGGCPEVWGGGTRDAPLPPSYPGNRGIGEDIAAGELRSP